MYIKLSFAYCDFLIPHSTGGRIISFEKNPEIIETLPAGVVPNQAVNIKLTIDEEGGKEQREVNDNEKLNDNERVTYDYYIDCQQTNKELIDSAITSFLDGFENKLAIAFFGEGFEAATQFSDDNNDSVSMPIFRNGNGLIMKLTVALDAAMTGKPANTQQLSGNSFAFFSNHSNDSLSDLQSSLVASNDSDDEAIVREGNSFYAP